MLLNGRLLTTLRGEGKGTSQRVEQKLYFSSPLTCARGPGSRGRDDVDVGVEVLLAALQLTAVLFVQIAAASSAATAAVAIAAVARPRFHVVGVHADAADAATAAGSLFVFVRQVVGEGREGR